MPRRSVREMSRHQQRAVMSKLTKGQIMRAHSLARRLERHKDGIKEPYALATSIIKKESKSNPAKREFEVELKPIGLTSTISQPPITVRAVDRQDALKQTQDVLKQLEVTKDVRISKIEEVG